MSESAEAAAAADAAAAAAAAAASSSSHSMPLSSVEAAAADLITECQVNVPYEEFADDVEHRLGRANGNVHVRKPGLEGVHDGQIMVRLKKKRFVFLDYGIEPNESDLLFAEASPHVKILDGAGRRKCTMASCAKIGVPVCLWDSEPEEVDSLYLRSGMCFTCQRNLNEKRRTERKRAPSGARGGQAGGVDHDGTNDAFGLSPSIIYAVGPAAKRFKTSHGGILELTHDAVIINAPSELLAGLVPSFGVGDGDGQAPASSDDVQQQQSQNLEHFEAGDAPGVTTSDGGGDRGRSSSSGHDVSGGGGGGGLLRSARKALADVERLVASSGEVDDHHGDLEGSASSSAAAAAAAATAAAVAAAVTAAAGGGGEGEGDSSHHHHLVSAEAAATAVHLLEQQQDGGSSRDDAAASATPNVHALYESALKSLLRSIYLLHQWKTSWDAAVETVSDPHFADAVASAAAVAAAAHAGAAAAESTTYHAESASFHAENESFHEAAGPAPSAEPPSAVAPGNNDPLGSNMVSLLLAADDKQRQTDQSGGELEHPDAPTDDDRESSLEGLSHAHQVMDGDDIVQEV